MTRVRIISKDTGGYIYDTPVDEDNFIPVLGDNNEWYLVPREDVEVEAAESQPEPIVDDSGELPEDGWYTKEGGYVLPTEMGVCFNKLS